MSEDPEVAKYLSCDEIREACRPERYVGTAMQQVDRTTAESARHVMGAQKKFRATVFRRPQ